MPNAVSTPESLLAIAPTAGPSGPVGPFGLPATQAPAPAQAPTITPAAPQMAGGAGNAGQAGQGGQAGQDGQAGTGGQAGQPQQPSQSNPFALSQVTSAIQAQLDTSNKLVANKNLILKQLYGEPLTDAEKAQLDPGMKQILESGDRNMIDFNLRLLNDQIAGRTNTVDQSVKYLADSYNTAQQQLETQKQNAIQNVQNFVTQYGSNAGAALKALYGDQYVNQLASMGINLAGFEAAAGGLPTIGQTRYQAQYGAGGVGLSIPQGTLAAQNNNPGNLRYAGQSGAAQGVGGFASFSSPQAGFDALVNDVSMKMQGQSTHPIPDGPTAGKKLTPDSSLEDMIRVYAPTADGNDPVGYAQTVARGLGVTPQTKLSQLDPNEVAAQMANHESGTTVTLPDTQAIAKAIESGQQPPVTTGLYGKASAVKGQLARDGFDLSKANLDWTATQTWMKTANSAQQLRLRQAINFAGDSLGVIDQMNQAWQGSGFPIYNKASLIAAEQGVDNSPLPQPLVISTPSPDGSSTSVTIKDKQTLANLLKAQISDLTSEMGTVYKGGYSSTDDSLELAAKNLSANWSYDTLKSALDLARTNLQIRKNSISTTGPVSTSGGTNPYTQTPAATGGDTGQSQTTPSGFSYTISP
jgi:hypothetical protein